AILYPVPQHAIAKYGESWTNPDNFVCNGPFQPKDWTLNKQSPGMNFSTNPTYHGRFSGNVNQAEVYFYGEYSEVSSVEMRKMRLQDFEHGRLDHLSLQGLDPAELRRARLLHQGNLVSLPLLSVGVLYFDTRHPPFNDVRIRRAFALATDRSTLANKALDGMHYPAGGGFIPPGMPGHVPNIALPFDPAQARHLLAEAGYIDGKTLPRLSFIAPFWAEWGKRQEAMLSRDWRSILKAEVTFDWLTYPETQTRLENDIVHMRVAGWTADYPDPDNFLNTAVPRHEDGWHNARYEQIIAAARRQSNQEQRLQLYREAEVILVDEVPILPLYYRRELVLAQPWLKNSPWDLLNGQLIWQDAIIEPH
ncbi:MAG: ABC transporter substrate-binding protein, partial [Candidatus Promineifilaceae bacterium]|nr:ABC transporter substrate-binding protein [Candidatus Promineifilaceae bacterium]